MVMSDFIAKINIKESFMILWGKRLRK